MGDLPEMRLVRNALGAVLFMEAANMTYQSFGTLNSSPWTIENVGADTEKASSMREYNWHAGFSALLFAGVAAYASRSGWPLLGVVIVFLYLKWIYSRAENRATNAGSDGTGWFDTWGKKGEDHGT